MPWRRHRRSFSRLSAADQATAWQVVSLLLDHPDETLVERVPMLTDAIAGLPDDVRMPLSRFLAHVESADLGELQRTYVDTFDVTRRCCLHLTYYLHGDTRNRGAALVRIKQDYRRAGGVLVDEDAELPDHLCVVLEFGAGVDADVAWRILNDHRVGIELLRLALSERRSPWLDVVDALRATLPRLDGDDDVALARLIAQGPPTELVGLSTELDAPYATPSSLDEAAPAGPTPVTIGGPR